MGNELPENLLELSPGQAIEINAPGHIPSLGTYIGWMRDERGDVVALVHHKGWPVGHLESLHPSCVKSAVVYQCATCLADTTHTTICAAHPSSDQWKVGQ